ncbi:MAG: hypothetical protein K0S23_1565 [Fluviicola sp.]|jgi:hypothetical protein|uniref:YtxH domain-containing protein n=1 Tax=Fluviicola sp. TaxID=1917219 RepID=UPI002617629F|nr:YtxH domain-containing protein [Fluviicola sp.]MDF3027258.1 hypothetical protein [Fluviicola sp.]
MKAEKDKSTTTKTEKDRPTATRTAKGQSTGMKSAKDKSTEMRIENDKSNVIKAENNKSTGTRTENNKSAEMKTEKDNSTNDNNSGGFSKVASAFVTGAAAGLTVGVLIASEKGGKIREAIMNLLNEFNEQLEEKQNGNS